MTFGQPRINYPIGDDVPTYKIEMSEPAYAVLCGLVQSSDDVNSAGIIAPGPVWNELKEFFPLTDFEALVAERVITYDKDWGE